MKQYSLPTNLETLHQHEEALRLVARKLIANRDLGFHFEIVERTMDILDIYRQYLTDDEDIKLLQAMSLRLFNAFASSIKLILSGYSQVGALVLRDTLETLFLLDLFRTDQAAIRVWRLSTKSEMMKKFKPVKVREALDRRDGSTEKKRGRLYTLFSELAAHPNMKSWAMLRLVGKGAHIGPFIDARIFESVVFEISRLAVQVGEILATFVPSEWEHYPTIMQMASTNRNQWVINTDVPPMPLITIDG